MSDTKDIWDMLTQNGPVPIEELPDRIADILEHNPSLATNTNIDTHLLYSGSVHDIPGWQISNGWIEQSGSKIGSLDTTDIGKLLNDIAQSGRDGSLLEDFADKIDFGTGNQKIIEDSIYRSFVEASKSYASQVEGRVITITPQSNPDAVFGKNEVPRVIDGLGDGVESGRITHVNGVSAAEFRALADIKDPELKRLSYKEAFDQSFSDRLSEVQPDAYRSADGRGGIIATTTEQIRAMGAADNITMKPPNTDGMTRIPGDDFAKAVAAAHTAHVAKLIEDGKLPQAVADAPKALENARASNRIFEADKAGELRGFAADPEGKTSYLIDTKQGVIYTLEKGELADIQKFDNSKEAGHAFGKLMTDAANAHPKAFTGLPEVHKSLGGLNQHIHDLLRPAWQKTLGRIGGGTADVIGKASKILGPVGVAAAGAEVYTLEEKLKNYVDFGLVPEDAMLAYRAILTAHTAQATVDPTLLGGEIGVQLAHDKWVKEYKIDPNVAESLEPGSLLEDIYDAKEWLKGQAIKAGIGIKDYVESRFGNPDLLKYDARNITDFVQDNFVDMSHKIKQNMPPIHKSNAVSAEQAGQAEHLNQAEHSEQSNTQPTKTRISISDAARVLRDDMPGLEADLLAKQANGELSVAETKTLDIVQSPLPVAMLQTLKDGGIVDLDISNKDMSSPQSRLHGILSAGKKAQIEADLPNPDLEPYYARGEQEQQMQSQQHQQDQEAELDYAYE